MHLFKPCVYIDYVPPKLSEGKEWFIYFSVKDPSAGTLKRVRIKLNHIHPIAERRRAAKAMMAALLERLALGWNPLTESKSPKSGEPMFSALDQYIAVKSRELESYSMRSYRSLVKIFKDWLSEHGFNQDTPASRFTESFAGSFMSDVDNDEKISPRTYNNYLAFFRTLFNWMVKRGYLDANPFTDIEKKAKRLTKKKRRLFTSDELERLFGYLQIHNREYLAMCLLCYYCLVRPKEISLLRCRDVDMERRTVHISADIAKNDNESYRTIPDVMAEAMSTLDLSHPGWYLFGDHRGWDFSAGSGRIDERKMANFWRYVLRPKLGFGIDLKMYSLKDTGITNMLEAGVPINVVQQQADHSSVAMTAIYVGKSATADSLLRGVDTMEKK